MILISYLFFLSHFEGIHSLFMKCRDDGGFPGGMYESPFQVRDGPPGMGDRPGWNPRGMEVRDGPPDRGGFGDQPPDRG